jgi:hypothetical protein
MKPDRVSIVRSPAFALFGNAAEVRAAPPSRRYANADPRQQFLLCPADFVEIRRIAPLARVIAPDDAPVCCAYRFRANRPVLRQFQQRAPRVDFNLINHDAPVLSNARMSTLFSCGK